RLPLSRQPGAAAGLRPRRLEPDRRLLREGRGRLLLVPGPHRRHDHLGGAQHLGARGGGGAPRTPRRGRVRRRGSAGRGPWEHRQGLRRPAPRRRARPGAGRGAAGLRESGDRALQIPAGHRVHRQHAAHRNRQASAVQVTAEGAVSEAGQEDDFEILQPEGWAKPIGYANGIAATGRLVFVAGQIGWNPTTGQIETDDFAEQAAQALRNIADVLHEAGAEPRHVVRMTWYITDKAAYLAVRKEIGQAWREVMGRHFPAMAVVVVSALIEDRAKVEIEATAVVPAASPLRVERA